MKSLKRLNERKIELICRIEQFEIDPYKRVFALKKLEGMILEELSKVTNIIKETKKEYGEKHKVLMFEDGEGIFVLIDDMHWMDFNKHLELHNNLFAAENYFESIGVLEKKGYLHSGALKKEYNVEFDGVTVCDWYVIPKTCILPKSNKKNKKDDVE